MLTKGQVREEVEAVLCRLAEQDVGLLGRLWVDPVACRVPRPQICEIVFHPMRDHQVFTNEDLEFRFEGQEGSVWVTLHTDGPNGFWCKVPFGFEGDPLHCFAVLYARIFVHKLRLEHCVELEEWADLPE